MKKTSTLLLTLALCAGAADAHKDRILDVDPDGAMRDVPAQFGPVRLIVAGLGSAQPSVQLRIGAHHTSLPDCVARIIRSTTMADILVTASWYHDEGRGLPFYLNIEFRDPGADPSRSLHSSHEFLFNLHNAELIDAKRVEAEQSGNAAQFRPLKLPAGCELNVNQ